MFSRLWMERCTIPSIETVDFSFSNVLIYKMYAYLSFEHVLNPPNNLRNLQNEYVFGAFGKTEIREKKATKLCALFQRIFFPKKKEIKSAGVVVICVSNFV